MLLRWLLFAAIGLPIQGVMYIAYPIIHAYWALFIHKERDVKLQPQHEALDPNSGRQTIFNGALLENDDDHGAFTQYGFIQKEGLELLQVDGALIRKHNSDGSLNRDAVSGDVVVAWFFANLLAKRPVDDYTLLNVVNHYIKNLGTLSISEQDKAYVSARCSNFGVNEAKDSEFLGLSQPAAGPQFYTTSAVLASAYNKGLKYKFLFWSHWVLMGGWYWAFSPVIYPNETSLVYVRDITMKALYIHLQVFGPKWWIVKPMQFINDKISSHKNQLFDAMMKRDVGTLPQVMNPFFSQRLDASSVSNDMSGRNSAYIADAIKDIQSNSKYRE